MRIIRWFVGLLVSGSFALALTLPTGGLAQAQAQAQAMLLPIAEDELAADGYDLDPSDAAEAAAATPAQQPQDPLDQAYADSASTRIDALERAGIHPPLSEPPHTFRSSSRLFAGEDDWRYRDDQLFAPLGLRAGSFLFYPEIAAQSLFTDNIFASSDGRKGDAALVLAPSLQVRSDWSRHELELFFGGEQKSWRSYHSENTTEVETRLRGRLDISSRNRIEAGARYARDTDGRGSTSLPDAAKAPGVIHAEEAYMQGEHKFNRLGFRLRGALERDIYEDVTLNSGTVLDNGGRDNDNQRVDWRTSYEFSPRLEVFADWEKNWRQFRREADASGFDKDRRGWLAAAGAKVEISPTINLSGRLGYARSRAEDARFSAIEGLIADGSLVWQPQPFVTATLSTRSEVAESTDAGVNGSFNNTIGFELATDWTYRLSSKVAASRTSRDFVDEARTETETVYLLGADYAVSSDWVLDASYRHTFYESGSAYRENEVRIGLKLRR